MRSREELLAHCDAESARALALLRSGEIPALDGLVYWTDWLMERELILKEEDMEKAKEMEREAAQERTGQPPEPRNTRVEMPVVVVERGEDRAPENER